MMNESALTILRNVNASIRNLSIAVAVLTFGVVVNSIAVAILIATR